MNLLMPFKVHQNWTRANSCCEEDNLRFIRAFGEAVTTWEDAREKIVRHPQDDRAIAEMSAS